MGVVFYPGDVATALAHLASAELAPQALLLHFDPTAGHGSMRCAYADLAAAYPAPVTLECIVPCRRDPSGTRRGGRADA